MVMGGLAVLLSKPGSTAPDDSQGNLNTEAALGKALEVFNLPASFRKKPKRRPSHRPRASPFSSHSIAFAFLICTSVFMFKVLTCFRLRTPEALLATGVVQRSLAIGGSSSADRRGSCTFVDKDDRQKDGEGGQGKNHLLHSILKRETVLPHEKAASTVMLMHLCGGLDASMKFADGIKVYNLQMKNLELGEEHIKCLDAKNRKFIQKGKDLLQRIMGDRSVAAHQLRVSCHSLETMSAKLQEINEIKNRGGKLPLRLLLSHSRAKELQKILKRSKDKLNNWALQIRRETERQRAHTLLILAQQRISGSPVPFEVAAALSAARNILKPLKSKVRIPTLEEEEMVLQMRDKLLAAVNASLSTLNTWMENVSTRESEDPAGQFKALNAPLPAANATLKESERFTRHMGALLFSNFYVNHSKNLESANLKLKQTIEKADKLIQQATETEGEEQDEETCCCEVAHLPCRLARRFRFRRRQATQSVERLAEDP